jgi:opacity protein-like surface antigen
MRKLLAVLILGLAVTLPAAAQDTPAGDVFVGYQYAHLIPGEGVSGFNVNGWNASASFNTNRWFGLVADFSGGYNGSAKITVPGFPTVVADVKIHTFLFGPRVTARHDGPVEPYAHVLVGAARVNGSIAGSGDSQSSFAMAVGGGADLKAGKSVAIRLLQADYLLTRFDGASGSRISQHNVRLSTGVVFRWGER